MFINVMFNFVEKKDTFIRNVMLKLIRNTLSAGLQHISWKNVFVHRKTVILSFALLTF